MRMDKADLSLNLRAAQFQALLDTCVFTDATGRSLGAENGIQSAMQTLRAVRTNGNRVYIIGNGGSAGDASHAVTDFMNVVKLRAHTLHDSSILTCMTNDFVYENAFARMLSQVVETGDALIAI